MLFLVTKHSIWSRNVSTFKVHYLEVPYILNSFRNEAQGSSQKRLTSPHSWVLTLIGNIAEHNGCIICMYDGDARNDQIKMCDPNCDCLSFDAIGLHLCCEYDLQKSNHINMHKVQFNYGINHSTIAFLRGNIWWIDVPYSDAVRRCV